MRILRFVQRHPAYFIVLGVIALLSSIVVPNVQLAMLRGSQKRTMMEMRTIATAWEDRAVDFKTYGIGRVPPRNRAVMYRVRSADLKRAVEPKYVRVFLDKDGWGRTYEFWVSGDAQAYAIRSRGADGRLDHQDIAAVGPTTNIDNDIVYSNGEFVEYPEGAG